MREIISTELTDPLTGEIKLCYLIKYANRIYKSIRIGTLDYYRKLEGNQADPMEGLINGITIESDSYSDVMLRSCRNAYIYCCSIEYQKFPDPKRMAHFKANEHSILDNVKEFSRMVSDELFIKAKTKEGLFYDREIHYIKCWDAPVRYLHRNKPKAELPLNVLDLFVYQKDPKFIIEQEYRLAWIFFDKQTHKHIEMSCDPVDIQCDYEPVTAYVEK